MIRHSSLSRFVALLAVLLGAGLVPYVVTAAGSDWTTSDPFRVLDTRPGQLTIDMKYAGGGRVGAGTTLELQLSGRAGIPEDAATVVLNLTATGADGGGHVTVHPCGAPRPNASNLNFATAATQANLVFARLDERGRVCLFASQTTHLIADVQSYTTRAITRIDAIRVLDSRSGGSTVDRAFESIGQQRSGSTVELQLAGRAGIPADADTVILNLTTAEARDSGYLTVHRCDRERPSTSNVNFQRGAARANLVVARLDRQGRACIYTSAPTHIIADAQGYTTDPVTELGPVRLLDTRRGHRTDDGMYAGAGRPDAGSTLRLALAGRAGIPRDANTVVLNVTAANPSASGYLTVYGCDEGRPNASNVNYTAHAARANVVVSRLDSQGRACIYTDSSSDVVVDVQGYIVGATIAARPKQVPPPVQAPREGAGFVHPGVLVDRTQLEEMRANVAAGRQPWAGVVDRMYNSGSSASTALRPTSYRFSSLSYVPAPVSVILASSSGNQSYLDAHGLSEVGDVEHIDDARAAYTHALLWYATGNQAHANKAIEIMNAWSRTLTEIKFDQPRRADNGNIIWVDGKLHAGWGGSLFSRAGEIIRYSNAGWATNDIARFEDMLRNVYLPLTIDGWSNGANWLMTLAEGTVSIGVFLDDRAAFDAGIAMWRKMGPTTIYHPNDGTRPLSPVAWMDTAAEIDNYWRNPNRYITGLQGEALRDLSHMMMGLGAMANTAETAYIQGINLYGEQAGRVVAGFELQAGYVNAYLDEVQRLGGNKPSSTWTPPNWPGDPGTFRVVNTYHTAGWHIAHHHYTTRAGIPMPQTSRLVQRLGPNEARASHHLSWEALTHS